MGEIHNGECRNENKSKAAECMPGGQATHGNRLIPTASATVMKKQTKNKEHPVRKDKVSYFSFKITMTMTIHYMCHV